METIDPRLYTFLEDVKANVTQGKPIEALRAIALDALLLAQELEMDKSDLIVMRASFLAGVITVLILVWGK